MRRRLLVTRSLPSPGPEHLAALHAEVRVLASRDDVDVSSEAYAEALATADVLLCQLTEPVDLELLRNAPTLRGIASMSVGTDHIDLAAATGLGIPVSNTPGVLTEATADLAWAALLGIARRVVEGDRFVRSGAWQRWSATMLLGSDVGPGPAGQPRVLGIVGFGRIGEAVARRAQGFRMEVTAYDPRHRRRIEESGLARAVELEELLRRSDFVSLHTPLTGETRHLIGAPQLAAMKPTAYLINSSRGPVVDEAALVDALRERRIAGAALDVFEAEPRLAPGLAELDNVLLLPHLGSATRATRGSMATTAVANAAAHLSATRAPNVVNPAVYETAAWRLRTGRTD